MIFKKDKIKSEPVIRIYSLNSSIRCIKSRTKNLNCKIVFVKGQENASVTLIVKFTKIYKVDHLHSTMMN